jgi:hypothetical protein
MRSYCSRVNRGIIFHDGHGYDLRARDTRFSPRAPNSARMKSSRKKRLGTSRMTNAFAAVGSYMLGGGNWTMEIRDSYSDRHPAVDEAVGRASREGLHATQSFEG